nr:MAG TPA: hypothetical protein [Caudoviricetes sp.]
MSMATAADITAKYTHVKGVNSMNNYVRSEAHLLDGKEHSGILDTETHDLFVLPEGVMLTGLKVVSLANTESSGAATVQFKLKLDGAAEAVGAAIGKGDLQTGDTVVLPVEKIKAYDPEGSGVIQMTVGTAALTTFKVLVIADYVPVHEFLTNG